MPFTWPNPQRCAVEIGCGLASVGLFVLTTGEAAAQTSDISGLLGSTTGESNWSRIAQIAIVITGLSVAPGLLMMVTCLPRFLIVFSFLRVGIGLPSTPSNVILIGLSLFMTLFVMAPHFDRAWKEGLAPLGQNQIKPEEAVSRISGPFKEFMLAHTRTQDLELFKTMAADRLTIDDAEPDLRILVPAFMISELRRSFEIGFLVLLPFLVIDLVVATITMAMGMMMVSPQVFALPMKVLFFILIDGWSLLIGSLVRSFG